MKVTQVRALSRHLLPHMPGYRQKGFLLYETPLDHIFRAFCFNDSAFDRAIFYVETFFVPLYVPTDVVYFNYGIRLGTGSGNRWDLNDPDLQDELLGYILRQGLPYLEPIREPRDVVAALTPIPARVNPHSLEAISYSLVMDGDAPAALRTIEHLKSVLDLSSHWQSEIMDRATLIDCKVREDPETARRQLLDWEEETVRNLGLQDDRPEGLRPSG